MLRAALLTVLLAPQAQACQTALILAMDVSQSVDAGEFRIQTDGLAAALRDPEIVETLVRDEIALSVLQWSGADRQAVSLDWTSMRSALHVANFAARVEGLERAFQLSDTAPAEAISFAMQHFAKAPECTRRVIDVSGDGTPNAGADVRQMRQRAQRAGITINGLAIEGLGIAVTNFYRRHLITRDGFVETAAGYRDYARAIRDKILREIALPAG